MPSAAKRQDKREEAQAPSGGRSMWSGTISFGLVSVPVTLRPAVREGRVAMRMLDQDGTPLARRYFCPKDNQDVPGDHLIRGYEIEPDKYVIVTDEELESLEPEKSRDIDLRLFVDAGEVDPIYFERAYFLVPDRESNKAYRLLAETMERTGKIGIATFVMHDNEYLVAILAEKGILRAETMRFHDEVRSPGDLELPEPDEAAPARVSRFAKAIKKLSDTKLDAKELKSTSTQRMLELLERKRQQGTDVVEIEVAAEEVGRDVKDLMAELRRSLDRHRSAAGAKVRRRVSQTEATRGEKAHPLSRLTKDELLERARKLKIPGRSKMGREELEKEIRRQG